ncbi:MAG: hypothetical protein WCO56_14650 [Verrucomicrobiota bacterium]
MVKFMRLPQRCRRLGRRPLRRVVHPAWRSARRSVVRRVVRGVVRGVLPYTGPSLWQVAALINACCKQVEKNPYPHPLKMYEQLLADKKARQQFEADFLRAYGPEAAKEPAPAPPVKPEPPPPPPPPPPKPWPPPDGKRDITPVPLRFNSSRRGQTIAFPVFHDASF